MSFLPYGSSTGGWLWAAIGSTFAHAGVIVGAFGLYSEVLARQEDAPQERQFTVTLERLDADTLAGIIEQEGEAGGEDDADPYDSLYGEPDYDDPDSADTETAEPVSTEEAEALDPVEPEEPEPDMAETLEPEMPDELDTETLEGTEEEMAALDPTEDLEAETVEPAETTGMDPVAPESLAGEPLAALDDPALTGTADLVEPVSPLTAPVESSPLIAETVVAGAGTPLAPADNGTGPQTVTGTSPDAATVVGTSATSVAVPPTEEPADAATAVTDTAESVTALNSATPTPTSEGQEQRPSRPPPSAQDLAIGDLIRRIRAAAADPCLLALPRRDGENGIGLAMIAARDSAIQAFSDTALTAEDADIRQTRTLVDQRQCPALTFIRQNQDYPATRLGLRIDQVELQSGETLTGVLRGTGGRYVTLLLIDDNGVVQDLQRFMAFSGNIARFDVPVSRSGPARDTKQILLAIATRSPPTPIKTRAGQLAQEVFAGLEGELATGAALAVETFDVR